MVKELNDVEVSLSAKELAVLNQEMQFAYSRMYFPHTWQSVIKLFRWLVEARRELKRVKASKGRALKRLNKLQEEHDLLKARCSGAIAAAVDAQELLRRIR